MDPKHPGYDAALAEQNANAIEWFYHQIDEVLGEVFPKLDANTTLLVLSDHGFAPYNRSFNLNTWLVQNGYIVMKNDSAQDSTEPLANVDWNKTRAYGLGLNGLYLNLRGRERQGIVAPGVEEDTLLKEISGRLLAERDPKTNLQIITRMDRASVVFQGPYSISGPDLLVGYNRGYRAGWQTILGAFPPEVIEDNTNPWSGDHCMAKPSMRLFAFSITDASILGNDASNSSILTAKCGGHFAHSNSANFTSLFSHGCGWRFKANSTSK